MTVDRYNLGSRTRFFNHFLEPHHEFKAESLVSDYGCMHDLDLQWFAAMSGGTLL